MRKTIVIDDIEIDIPGIMSLAHACDPGLCRQQESCCAHYEICCEEHELSGLIGLFANAAQYAPALRAEDGYDNVFEETDAGLFSIDAAGDGLCVFAYRDGEGRALCSLHTAAYDLGLDYFKGKLRACLLWPLAVTEDVPPLLSAHPDALRFPCNRRRASDSDALDPDVAEILRGLFGPSFYERLCTAIRERQKVPDLG